MQICANLEPILNLVRTRSEPILNRLSTILRLNLHLALLVVYSVGVIALGLWAARFVRRSSDFFVGGRTLGPGLIFASMLAANIGAGSTVGAAGRAYRDGISTWFWVGSAGLASLVFALVIAPRLWRLAKAHDFYTTGDYLEFRYGAATRALAALVICSGSLTLLAGQLIAGAAILNVIVGIPRWAGSLIGAAVMTIYFAAGGLLGSAWVNTLQLGVMLAGFAVALPFALDSAGGLGALTHSTAAPPWFGDFFYSAGPLSGWTFLFLTGPSFLISPGLIQKAYGAKSERALKIGVSLNAVVLLLFAFLPVLLGMAARTTNPGITDENMVLPTFLATQLPVWLGALALAAVFSTEVDTCDAILFMLSTSMSKDIYQRHINPAATDAQLLRVARLSAVIGGAAGVVLSIYLATVVGALAIFYGVIIVSLLVPILGGLYVRRADGAAAIAAMVSGLVVLFAVYAAVTPRYRWADPVLAGLAAAAAAYAAVTVSRRASAHAGSVQAG
jgi:solute:Na+ symporter, SSS family